MGAPKIKPSELITSQDKKLIEALRQRLNEKLQDPKLARKAALILESWIHHKRK